jgi:4-hydroxybenzoate polyprenyltransferase
LGPILRRAEEKQVCIWVACNLPVSIKAEVYRFSELETARKNGSQPVAIGFGVTKSIRLGDHLHIALVIARPAAIEQNQDSAVDVGFPTDILLAYDLEIIDMD